MGYVVFKINCYLFITQEAANYTTESPKIEKLDEINSELPKSRKGRESGEENAVEHGNTSPRDEVTMH